MAKACYDPEEGPKVWQRMTKMAKGQPNVPKFLSTHPQNQDRQERLRSHMEEVLSTKHESLFWCYSRFACRGEVDGRRDKGGRKLVVERDSLILING